MQPFIFFQINQTHDNQIKCKENHKGFVKPLNNHNKFNKKGISNVEEDVTYYQRIHISKVDVCRFSTHRNHSHKAEK